MLANKYRQQFHNGDSDISQLKYSKCNITLYKVEMKEVRSIAFYLPQYHEIHENNKWWGKGFTEWTNVKKAKPLFKGHIQPHTPADELGYYDLSNIEVLEKQAKLASDYGIYGFCLYHYWFDGKKLLDTPLNNILRYKKPDFPFCLCWANENWTRTWDGQEQKILISQKHSDGDDAAFINDLVDVFKDHRYIKIDGKPVLLIYRTSLFPDIKKSAGIWRHEAKKAGIKDLYLVRVEGIEEEMDPGLINFDAAVEFAPDWRLKGRPINNQRKIYEQYVDKQVFNKSLLTLYDYNLTMNNMVNKKAPRYKYFRGAFPSWDNTPRRGEKGTIFWGANPESFHYFLTKQKENTLQDKLLGDNEKLIFINAWNEWGEGCHLEPDKAYKNEYLKGVKDSIQNFSLEMSPLYATLSKLDWELKSKDAELGKSEHARQVNLKQIQDLTQHIEYLEKEIQFITNSKSWKATEILRKINRRMKL